MTKLEALQKEILVKILLQRITGVELSKRLNMGINAGQRTIKQLENGEFLKGAVLQKLCLELGVMADG